MIDKKLYNHNDTAIIILAAGKGTRMKSDLPKVMHKIAGKAMIERVIETACGLSVGHISVVINQQMLELQDFFASVIQNYTEQQNISRPVYELFTQEQQLGTAHAVRAALDASNNIANYKKILVLYGDTALLKIDTLSTLLNKLDDDNNGCVIGFYPDNPGKYGRLIIDGQQNIGNESQKIGETQYIDNKEGAKILEIIEYKDATDQQRAITLCNSGVMGFNIKSLLENINKITNDNASGEYYLTDMVKLINSVKKSCAYIIASEAELLGINSKVDLAKAEYEYQQILRYQAMHEYGVTMLDPATIYLSDNIEFGKNVVIEPNVQIKGTTKIADNVHIKSFSYIENAIIGEAVSIGPFARIRPDSVIQSNVNIGNFVEIKNSIIADGVKINHLSYIGDRVDQAFTQ
ncbi:MAG: NTP transferase domain-containing protein [Pseudomonadota bacterium]